MGLEGLLVPFCSSLPPLGPAALATVPEKATSLAGQGHRAAE